MSKERFSAWLIIHTREAVISMMHETSNFNVFIVGTVVTEARVRKILHKLVDEGVLPENWGANEMPIVAKNLTRAVFEDCLKEEPDVVAKVSSFGKVANSIAMKIARDMI